MPIMRENPLPVGRYWFEVVGSKGIERFDAWLKEHGVTVDVVSSALDSGGGMTGREPSSWTLFDVKAPTDWPRDMPGLPSTADETIRTPDDTISKPAPEKDWQWQVPPPSELIGPAASTFGWALGLGLVGGVGYLIYRLTR